MLFCLSWLRELCPVEEDLDRITEALTARGLTVDSVAPVGDDHALELDIPANRPDCLGHLGVARELAAAFGVPLKPRVTLPATEEGPAPPVRVSIEDPDLCPRYTAGIVRGVRSGPSPDRVGRRLEICGLRSINTVVDISNLVLLELGHPIHFFDLARVRGGEIVVRPARSGETLTTLDNVSRKLDPSMLMIADGQGAVAVAGVMGGADSEIRDTTEDVLIEAAAFAPRSVRGTARALGLSTDASYRFERGVDPEGAILAQALATHWLRELAGGRYDPPGIDVYPAPPPARTLTLRDAEVERLLGYRPQAREIESALSALQFQPRRLDAGELEVTPPSFRMDIEREADLVEEVARHLGYDRVPLRQPALLVEAGSDPGADPEERVRDRLPHLGFHEAFGYAMIGRGEDDDFVPDNAPPPLELSNPLSETMTVLRRSILPGLLRAVDLNLRRGVRDVRLFEVGHVFLGSGSGFPEEPRRLGLAWSGAGSPRHWSGADRETDLYDILGVAEDVLALVNGGAPPRVGRGGVPALHPAQSVRLRSAEGREIGWCGALHPARTEDLGQPVFVAELDLLSSSRPESPVPQHQTLPRLGAVQRDLSLIVPRETPFSDLLRALESVTPPAPVDLFPVDRYEGRPLADDEVSLTVRITLQPDRNSLTEAEIESYRLALIEALGTAVRIRS